MVLSMDNDLVRSHPLRADAARNRELVLEAAAGLFAVHGGDSTLNDVARAAGLGVGTVYRKFPDKEAVLDALLDQKIDSLAALAEAATSEPDPGVAFRGFLLNLIEKRATDRGLDAVLTSASRQQRFTEELERRLVPTVDRLIGAALEAGEVRSGVSSQEVCLLAFMVGKVADITRPDSPDLWRRYAQLLIDGTRQHPDSSSLTPDPLLFSANAAALGRAG
jgi:AcrR family transcriptional regulator